MKKALRSLILLLALTALLGAAEGNKGYSPDDARMAWWRESTKSFLQKAEHGKTSNF